MSRVIKHLKKWESEGLIDRQQVDRIIEFETGSGTSYTIYGLIMLGITVLSIGVISVVAANWKDIPDFVKIVSAFSLISLTAGMIYYADAKEKSVLFDAFTALFMFLYLASIGLISQIYHTGGHLYQALFLWTFVVMPVILFTHGKFTQGIWVISFLTAIIVYCITGFIPAERYLALRVGIIMSLPVFCGIMGTLLSHLKITEKMSGLFMFFGISAVVFSIFCFDFWHSLDIRYDREIREFLYILSPFYITLTIVTLLFLILCFQMKTWDFKIRLSAILLSLFYAVMLFLCIPIAEHSGGSHYYYAYKLTGVGMISPVISISGLFFMAFLFSSMGYKKLFSLFLNLIGLRFLIIYFQVFGSLAYTGFGLIISGLLIIASVIVWKKYSMKLFSRFIQQ